MSDLVALEGAAATVDAANYEDTEPRVVQRHRTGWGNAHPSGGRAEHRHSWSKRNGKWSRVRPAHGRPWPNDKGQQKGLNKEETNKGPKADDTGGPRAR